MSKVEGMFLTGNLAYPAERTVLRTRTKAPGQFNTRAKAAMMGRHRAPYGVGAALARLLRQEPR
jgi:hypothetical protein